MIHIFTYVYFALPLLIFIFGWLKLPYAVCTTLVLIGGMIAVFKQYVGEKITRMATSQLLFIIVLSLAITYITGAGAFVPQNTDWVKHNAVLHDLVTFEWPFGYTYPHIDGAVTLSYYLGWYMVPAFIGKLSGYQMALYAQFAYTFLGILLIFLHTSRFAKGKNKTIYLVAVILCPVVMSLTPLQQLIHITNLLYFSHIGSLRLVPNQAIPVILVTCIYIYDYIHNRAHFTSLIWLSITLFWSPLALMGIVPLMVLHLTAIRSFTRISCIILLHFALVLGLMYLWYKPNVFNIQARHLFTYLYLPHTLTEFIEVLIFLMIQIVFPILLVKRYGSSMQREMRTVWYVTICFLSILPFLHYGVFNDLVTRGSIGGVFTMSIIITHVFGGFEPVLLRRVVPLVVIYIFLFISNLTGVVGVFSSQDSRSVATPKPVTEFESSDVLTQQYIGYGNSFFMRRLMKPIAYLHKTTR